MPLDKFRAANRANWDDRVPIHLKAKTVYDIDGFIADPERISPTVEFDRHQLGDVTGKSLLHLQCHIGHDTLSWARLGATVTGVDFSEPTIAAARDVSLRSGTPGRCVLAELYDSPAALPEQFDIVYTGVGALIWLPNIAEWARVVAKFGIAAVRRHNTRAWGSSTAPLQMEHRRHEQSSTGQEQTVGHEVRMNGPEPRPNIILINTDQQRYDTIRALGFPYMVTPNLDRLVEKGVTFTNCFVGAPACGPNRASLFSGYYPHTTGMGKNGDLWQRTWVSLLGEAGYYTANVGKMHLTPFDAKAGFDYRFNVENKQRFRQWALHEDEWDRGVMAHGLRKPEREDYEKRDDYEQALGAFEWELPDHLHSDMFLGDAAVRWIERYQLDRPFFLEIGFPGPHPPYDPIDRWREQYEHTDLPLLEVTEAELAAQPDALKRMHVHNTEVAHDSVFHILRPTEEQRLRQRRYYMANVSMIDEKIGQIVAALEKRGFMENAVLFFTSDHGDTLTDHGSSQKWTMYDIVTRVPTIAWAPGRCTGGRTVEEQYQWMDLGPTVLELAGVEVPETFEAISMLPALNGDPEAGGREYVFAEHDREDVVGLYSDYQTMVRGNGWKLVHFLGEENGQLFDMQADPDEVNNLWSNPKHAEKKQELLNVILEWRLRSTHTAGQWAAEFR